MTLIKNKIKSAENKELLKNPLVRGMLNTIRCAINMLSSKVNLEQ